MLLSAELWDVQEDRECHFQPVISPVSELIVATRRVYEQPCAETAEEQADRLSVQSALRQEASRRAAQQQHYGQFTFKPDINTRSQRLAEVTTALVGVPPD